MAESDGFEPLNTLRKAIRLASQSIAQQAMMDPQHLGMGTTCACFWLIGKRLYTASVGDSRIYLLRERNLHKLTTDYIWIQEANQGLLLSAGDRTLLRTDGLTDEVADEEIHAILDD